MKNFYFTLVFISLFFSTKNIYGRIWKYDLLVNNNIPYCDVVIQDIIRDTVVIAGHGQKYLIDINDITYISRERESKGTMGMIIGGILGILIIHPSAYWGPDWGTLLFSGIGGLVGILVGSDEQYDFTCLVYDDKVELIKTIIKDKRQRLF